MKIFSKKLKLTSHLHLLRSNNVTIGFVPTMGALHKGHISLVKKALENNKIVVVSIFVNPTQFNDSNDLKTYPRSLASDIDLLLNTTPNIILYTPTDEDIYGSSILTENYSFNGIENEMEGAYRPGHFNGVATVVKKLFEIIEPHNAYFGEKDFQQLQIIQQLVHQLNLPININACPICRATDGLAISSRNVKLSKPCREAAPFIYKILKTTQKKFSTKSANFITKWVIQQFEKHPLLKLEYFTIAHETSLKPVQRKSANQSYRAFIAVYANGVRLIDNMALNSNPILKK